MPQKLLTVNSGLEWNVQVRFPLGFSISRVRVFVLFVFGGTQEFGRYVPSAVSLLLSEVVVRPVLVGPCPADSRELMYEDLADGLVADVHSGQLSGPLSRPPFRRSAFFSSSIQILGDQLPVFSQMQRFGKCVPFTRTYMC